MKARTWWPRVLGAWLLMVPGVLAFQPIFGGWAGHVPALVGVTTGTLLAVVAVALHFGPALWVGAILLCYLLLGGPIAAPETVSAGFLPTVATVRRLVVLIWESWSEILTVAVPAVDIPGPAAAPLLLGMVAATAFVGVVLRTRSVVAPLLIPVGWLGAGIALGIHHVPDAWWLGIVTGAGMLVWTTVHRLQRRRDVNARFLVRRARGFSSTAWKAFTAGTVIALACGTALGVNLVSGAPGRQVLRDHVTPPLNLSDYPSPLTKFRFYEVNLEDEVLFTVDALPPGGRLRLAVMDHWDGVVFNVSQDSRRYLRVGREMPWQPEGELVQATITAEGYSDVWVPSFGEPSRVEFSGPRSQAVARSLHLNQDTGQLLTSTGIAPGNSIQVASTNQAPLSAEARGELAGRGIGPVPPGRFPLIPEVLSETGRSWAESGRTPYEQLSLIEEKLRTEGRFSDGRNNDSRAGHTAERLAFMFNSDQYVGDDEQYAVAMALMASQLGIPVRVVLGFYPEQAPAPGQPWQVLGAHAHVWVEANIEGAGWVSFDPTPPRDQLPNPDNTVPKPQPKPRVESPPLPPERYEDEQVQTEEENVDLKEPEEEPGDLRPLLIAIGIGLGSVLLLLSPLLLVAAWKLRRRRHRRNRGTTADQIAGAWGEVVDRARDLGFTTLVGSTRRETAEELQQTYPELGIEPLATRIDSQVFGADEPSRKARDESWQESDLLRRSLLMTRPWYARAVALFSVRSLRRGRSEAAEVSSTPKRDPRARRAEEQPEASRGARRN
ncbi:MAG: transglutaminase domain-containing protein [Arachnia propionica]|uniref:transglutaminaseTgpA domain-containing protein n=1 Tax=Arachnia propionica TaxID=1750 RepID=UPI0026FBD9C0|nr:transglutaminase domain-containing protein [Arachnia propionica]